MRAKVVVPILGAAGLLLLAVVLHFGVFAPVAPAPGSGASANASAVAAASPRPADLPSAAAPQSFQPQVDAAAVREQRQEAAEQRVAEIRELAANKNPNALRTILPDLTSADKDVRAAALAAAIDFGDRSAIPAMQAALETIPDAQEKVNIQQAINYLKLPTLTEENLSMEAGNSSSASSRN